MTLSVIDRDGRSTIAAAEAQAALASGDTLLAREKYAEAGAILERAIASALKQSEKHLIRFLAATQFYKGGHYQKAYALTKKIQARLLPRDVRSLFLDFLQDVKSRASSEYEIRVRRELQSFWQHKDYTRLLEVLREHPYALPPVGMASIRASACEALGNYRAAALFYAYAIRLNPTNSDLMFAPAAFPLTLPQQGKLEEAWEYACHLLELIPNTVTYVIASLLCFHRAAAKEGTDGRSLLEDQVQYFNQARASFADLAPAQQGRPEIRFLMALGFEAAAFGLHRMGDLRRFREMCDSAVNFEPESSNPWTVRGILTYPEPGAVADFRRAIALGDDSYFPFYFLAHDALVKDDFRSAFSWSQEALKKKQRRNPRIESQLYGWLAICRIYLGGSREEVEGLFLKAREIDPANKEAESNYRLFLDSYQSRPLGSIPAWDRGRVPAMGDQFMFDRESRLSEGFGRTNPLQHELLETLN